MRRREQGSKQPPEKPQGGYKRDSFLLKLHVEATRPRVEGASLKLADKITGGGKSGLFYWQQGFPKASPSTGTTTRKLDDIDKSYALHNDGIFRRGTVLLYGNAHIPSPSRVVWVLAYSRQRP